MRMSVPTQPPAEELVEFPQLEEEALSSGAEHSARNRTYRPPPIPCAHAPLLIASLGVLLLAFYLLPVPAALQGSSDSTSPLPFNKLLWLYTENELQAESMYELVYLYHLQEVFLRHGYQVRQVNSLNAYDYISSDDIVTRITRAMQSAKIDEGVHNLLKLALLAEHGGVIINGFDTVLLQDLSWIQNAFAVQAANSSVLLNASESSNGLQTSQSPQSRNHLYTLSPNQAQILLYSHRKNWQQLGYFGSFMAARPNSSFIRQAFSTLETLISTGGHLYAAELGVFAWNEDTAVNFLRKGLLEVLNLVIYEHQKTSQLNAASYFGLQTLKHKNSIFLNELSRSEQERLLFQPSQNSLASVLFNVNQPAVKDFLDARVTNLYLRDPDLLPPDSIIAALLSAPGNKEVFIDKLPRRNVQICLIVMENLTSHQVTSMQGAFDNQTYQNWKLVLPSTDTTHKTNSERVILMPAYSTKVHNIEQACTRHCHPKGYAVLLNYNDRFNSPTALQHIALAVEPRDLVGAYLAIEREGKLEVPQPMKMNRKDEGIVNRNITKMEAILNHFRVFSVECFRLIPQFDLRDYYGQYFGDRIIFVMSLIEMVLADLNLPRLHYLCKKYAAQFNIPNALTVISRTAFLRVATLETVDRSQLERTRARLQFSNMYDMTFHSLKFKVPFTKLLAFNKGDPFTSVDRRSGPQLIPKVIHQVWLGGKLPAAKDYFFRKTQKMHPDFQVKLWRNEDITRQRFPLTYDLMQTLLQFNQRSPYNKLAVVTDILRHELLHSDGGFWKDAGVNLLRPVFQKFLRYKLAITVDKSGRHRWLQGMCFFANMPRLPNLWRITNFRNTNRMRIYNDYALAIAGPIDFRQLIVGQQEYDPDFLLMPYETLYPAQVTQHPERDRCLRRAEEIGELKYEFQENGCYLLSDCDQIYPNSFAVQHNCFGNTWHVRKAK